MVNKFHFIFIGLFFAAPLYAGGTIQGIVTLRGNPPPAQRRAIVSEHVVCGTRHTDDDLKVDNGHIENVVVYLEGPMTQGKALNLNEPKVVEQKGCQFVPHLTLLPAGAPLLIKNSDGILHNFRTLSRANPPQNLSQMAGGPPLRLILERPEVIELACDLHRWMQAWVVVMGNAYYALSDAAGHYQLTDVPAGDYRLVSWQERLGRMDKRVVVHEGEVANQNFIFVMKP